ncbi:hypothetical protein SAFG77S_08840 [Streptomyces afghaniensis]
MTEPGRLGAPVWRWARLVAAGAADAARSGQPGSARPGPAWPGPARLGPARPGPARPGPARLGLSRLGSADATSRGQPWSSPSPGRRGQPCPPQPTLPVTAPLPAAASPPPRSTPPHHNQPSVAAGVSGKWPSARGPSETSRVGVTAPGTQCRHAGRHGSGHRAAAGARFGEWSGHDAER